MVRPSLYTGLLCTSGNRFGGIRSGFISLGTFTGCRTNQEINPLDESEKSDKKIQVPHQWIQWKCGKSFARIYELPHHEKVCPLSPKNDKIPCDNTAKGFKFTLEVENAMKLDSPKCKCHPNNIQNYNFLCSNADQGCLDRHNSEKIKQKYTCQFKGCSKNFASEKTRDRHEKWQCTSNPNYVKQVFEYDQCDDAYALKRHKESKHPTSQ